MSDPILVPATPNKLVVFPTGMGEDITPEIDDRILVGDKSDGWKGKWMSMRKLPTGGFHGTWETIYEMLGSGAIQGQYGYLRVNDAYYPMFCTNSNSTAIESWFAVTGFTSVLPATTPGLPVITSSTYRVFRAGTFVSFQITATNNPLNYSATGLPPGISCNPVTGLISGELAPSGLDPLYTVDITATNFLGSGTMSMQFAISTQLVLDVVQPNVSGFALFRLKQGVDRCIRVRNSSGDELIVGFEDDGWVDLDAISTHCGSGNGYVSAWYDQRSSVSTPSDMVVSVVSPQLFVIYTNGEPVLFNGKPAIWNPYANSDEPSVSGMLFSSAYTSISDMVVSFIPTDLRKNVLAQFTAGLTPGVASCPLVLADRVGEEDPLVFQYEGSNGSGTCYVQSSPDEDSVDIPINQTNLTPYETALPLNELKTLRFSPSAMRAQTFGFGRNRYTASVGHSIRGYIVSVFYSPPLSPLSPLDYSTIYNEVLSRYSL